MIIFFRITNIQVLVPSIGKLALDLMCGDWGASRCSPEKWFDFMGNATGNPFVPFQITYITTPLKGYTQLDPPITPCNKAINVSFDRFVSNKHH